MQELSSTIWKKKSTKLLPLELKVTALFSVRDSRLAAWGRSMSTKGAEVCASVVCGASRPAYAERSSVALILRVSICHSWRPKGCQQALKHCSPFEGREGRRLPRMVLCAAFSLLIPGRAKPSGFLRQKLFHGPLRRGSADTFSLLSSDPISPADETLL